MIFLSLVFMKKYGENLFKDTNDWLFSSRPNSWM